MQDLTMMHPLSLAFAIASGFLMMLLPRRAAVIPLLFAVIFIPLQQRVVIFTLDFFVLRIIVLFGWLRVMMRGEFQGFAFNRVDKLMLLWSLASIVMYSLLWKTGAAFVNRLGISFDIIGVYFLTRFLVRDMSEIVWVIRTLALVSIPVAAAMMVELFTGKNLFSIFGGVPEYTVMRDGKMRCQGAFAHSITAGTFSASLLPLFVAARKLGKKRHILMYIGLVTATLITISTASSGPAVAYMAGWIGVALWYFRDHMRKVRWGIALSLFLLSLVMNAPVWALILRVKIFGASTAYHRYRLFDQFVNRVGEWWLNGVQSTASWGPGLFDVTNQYVRIAVDGGLLTLALFIAVLAYAFQSVGKALKSGHLSPDMQKIAWALGASLLVHVISFFGVAYFDQIRVILYMNLGMLGTLLAITEKEERRKKAEAREALKTAEAAA